MKKALLILSLIVLTACNQNNKDKQDPTQEVVAQEVAEENSRYIKKISGYIEEHQKANYAAPENEGELVEIDQIDVDDCATNPGESCKWVVSIYGQKDWDQHTGEQEFYIKGPNGYSGPYTDDLQNISKHAKTIFVIALNPKM